MSNVRDILDDVEYLVPLITYLGSNPYWWARSAPSLSRELSLDSACVQKTFEKYPMIFRKSLHIDAEKADSYALQLRYAQRRDGQLDHPPQVSSFPVLSESQVFSLIDFLVRISTVESTISASRRAMYVAVLAAILSAATAIMVAILK